MFKINENLRVRIDSTDYQQEKQLFVNHVPLFNTKKNITCTLNVYINKMIIRSK